MHSGPGMREQEYGKGKTALEELRAAIRNDDVRCAIALVKMPGAVHQQPVRLEPRSGGCLALSGGG